MAARLKQEAGEEAVDRERQSRGGQGDANKPAKRDTSVQALTDQAKAFAGGRSDLIALADEVARAGTRGRAGGPKRGVAVVRGKAIDQYEVVFREHELAVVTLSGDGDTDLDLLIYDEQGRLVCQQDGRTDHEICRWIPAWTGKFRVVVVNVGPIANQYVLITN